MRLYETVYKILNAICKGDFFDSHVVINEIFINSEYHQTYLEEYPKGYTVAQYHGKIAQMIEETGLAEKVQINFKDVFIKTHTIYGDLSKNHLWKKI